MFYADDGLLVGWSEEVVQRGLNLFASLCADLGLYITGARRGRWTDGSSKGSGARKTSSCGQ